MHNDSLKKGKEAIVERTADFEEEVTIKDKKKQQKNKTRTLGQSIHQCADTEEDNSTCSRLQGIDRIKPVA